MIQIFFEDEYRKIISIFFFTESIGYRIMNHIDIKYSVKIGGNIHSHT